MSATAPTRLKGTFWINQAVIGASPDFQVHTFPKIAKIFDFKNSSITPMISSMRWADTENSTTPWESNEIKLEMVLTDKLKREADFIFVMFVYFIAQTQIVSKRSGSPGRDCAAIQRRIDNTVSVLSGDLKP